MTTQHAYELLYLAIVRGVLITQHVAGGMGGAAPGGAPNMGMMGTMGMMGMPQMQMVCSSVGDGV